MTRRGARLHVLPGLVLALGMLGCDAMQLSATLGTGGFGAGQSAAALVGRWFRVTSSPDLGTVTETTWRFASDGTATRTTTVRTALGAVIERSTAHFDWQAGLDVLVLRFGPPSFRVDEVGYFIDYTVEGTFLYLDGVPFLRAGP